MSHKKISQREARRLKAENKRLREERFSVFRRAASQYPGTQIDTISVQSEEWHIVETARKLGHAVFLVADEHPKLRVYGLREPNTKT